MNQVEARRRLLAGVVLFVAVGLALHFLLGLPAWLAIVIPGFVLGALEVTAVAAIHDLATTQREAGKQVWGAGVTPEEQRMIQRYGPGTGARGFTTLEKAIAAAQEEPGTR
jgi:hypothetical protein